MIGIVLIYYIGKSFSDLATKFLKNKWLYAILGVAMYYVGTFIAGIIIALYYEGFTDKSLDDVPEILLSLLAVPIGLLTCWLFYKLLEKNWVRSDRVTSPDLLDDDMTQ